MVEGGDDEDVGGGVVEEKRDEDKEDNGSSSITFRTSFPDENCYGEQMIEEEMKMLVDVMVMMNGGVQMNWVDN